ncbi:MAG: GNAT family N-acetyltransferase [Oscillospiraceae bacterium]|nr:GNAT family N-acetyltransferase [Oscillospiraceae bacterium]MCL2279458.1 GNAT family N-acetyltransferase [Oscillospiraceae bacterium]
MKIVDATWEKRNLGVLAKEVTLDIGDTVSDLEQLNRLNSEYTVIRVPAGSVELMFKLEDMGYRFIETIINIQHNHKDIGSTLDRITKRIADSITYFEMNETELSELWQELRGGIFYTDRISLDPAFSVDKAAERYIGWMSDLLSQGGKVLGCIFKDDIFGYFTSKIDAGNVNRVDNIGIYKNYENAGLGVALVNASIRYAQNEGAKMTVSSISSNNMPALKANLAAGYSVTSAQYIYIRHTSGED